MISIITQMFLLALALRKNGKLLDSLNILVEIEHYFPKNNPKLDHLKSVWYNLISKVYLEIKDMESKQKRNRWKNVGLKSSRES